MSGYVQAALETAPPPPADPGTVLLTDDDVSDMAMTLFKRGNVHASTAFRERLSGDRKGGYVEVSKSLLEKLGLM